ncbi:MAG: RNA 2',3'-cyclic phosphodiesterase [Alphaproteobacteria bacterium]
MRLFVGIGMPLQIQDRLRRLRSAIPGARWIDQENLHLTLRFIGEVAVHDAEEIDLALGRIDSPAFDLALRGVGHFETGGEPSALWADIAPCPALARLQEKVDSALRRTGLRYDTRNFRAHVTLARLKAAPLDRVRSFLRDRADFRSDSFLVDRFTLFSSHLGKHGAQYVAEADYPLGGGVLTEWDDEREEIV